MSEIFIDTKAAFLDYQFEILGLSSFLSNPDITEICINKPGELFVEKSSGWERIEVPTLTFERAKQFCTAVVNESRTGQSITNSSPLVSFTFPTGQRAQFVIPPACEAENVSITIRLPSKRNFTLEQYTQNGFFERVVAHPDGMSDQDKELIALKKEGNYAEFFSKAVLYKKNIVVAGATGSGKTTFMKSLVNHIPDDERLVTIEDARELFLTQPNVVYLLYSKGGQSIANISAKHCMEACLRMKPDRILLAEIRGDESFFFIRNCASGHPGSITSCHAGSVDQAWDQLSLMVKASPEGSAIEYAVIKQLLRQTIDIMVHIRSSHGKRVITGVEFTAENSITSQSH
jgi:type IV secretion system protein VirB11